METFDGCKYREEGDHYIPLDLHHQCSKISTSADHSFIAAVDSGYGSTYSITQFNTPNVSSNLSSLISPKQTVHNNGNLIAIPETSDTTKLTPVTQNIRKITEFHITTPKSRDFPLAATKRHSIAALNFEDYQSTPKKSKIDFELRNDDLSLKNVEHTFRYSRKAQLQRKLYREKLASAPDFDTGLEESFDVENVSSSQRSDFSPISIKTHNREKRTPLSSSNINLQSSTPKSCGYKPKITAINITQKAPSVKKLSFSDQQFGHVIDQVTKSESCTLISHNGSLARQEFEPLNDQIRKCSNKLNNTQSTSDFNVTDIYQEDSFRGYKKLYPVINSVLKDREISKRHDIGTKCENLNSNIRSKSRIPVLDSSIAEFTVTSKIKNFKDYLSNVPACSNMEISPVKSPNSQNASDELEWTFDFEKNYNLKTNSDLELNWSVKCDTTKITPPKIKRPFLENCERAELEQVRSTPKKQKLYSVDQERLDILYPTIPRTPSKKPCTVQISLKRKIDIQKRSEKRPRKFYDGITNLNIISKLESYSLVLDKIFGFLSSQDLLNSIRVSKNWKRIIRSNNKANARLKKYLQEWKLSKENGGEYKLYENVCGGLVNCKKNETTLRMPFSQSNKNDRKRSSDTQQSPPVSPSKRKFHENQKVVRTLADNEKLTKCPRCGKPSRIINMDSTGNLNNDITSSTILSYSETFQATKSTFYCINKNHTSDLSISQPICNTPRSKKKLTKSLSVDLGLLSAQTFQQRRLSLPVRSFGICSGLGCKFKFCLECLCEHHPGIKCKLSEPTSPSKEDLQNGILEMNSISTSRSLKSRRKSLKRLCF